MTVYFNDMRTAFCNLPGGAYIEAVEVESEADAVTMLEPPKEGETTNSAE